MIARGLALMLLILPLQLAWPAPPAWAQSSSMEDRLREQLREAVSKLRSLQSSYDSLQAENSRLERESSGVARSSSGPNEADMRAENASLRQALSQSNAQLAQSRTNLDQVVTAARKIEAERNELRAKMTTADAELAGARAGLQRCGEQNAQLVEIGNQILAAYRKVGLGDVLGKREPFIGAKRVELENAAQSFGDQIYDNTHRPAANVAPAP